MKSVELLTDEDLFPDCMLPDCESKDFTHQHVLLHQKRILSLDVEDDSGALQRIRYRYCQGGVGSAKSRAFAAMVVKLSLTIDDNRGVVGRRDYPLLWDTSWSDIKECIKNLVEREFIDEEHYKKHMFSRKTQGDHTIIEFENGSIITAFETKNILRGLGASYGFYWIDDAMESYEEIFLGDKTNAGLMSRLRLPRVAFCREADGSVSNKLHGMLSSNPPPTNHWLHRLFGKTAHISKIGDDYVDTMVVETFLNPFVGSGYTKSIIAMQKKAGRDADVVDRVIFGQSKPAYDGVPVYTKFKNEKHVGQWNFDPKLPFVRCWDFGSTHPAVIFGQLFKCDFGTNHFRALSEIADKFSITIYQLYSFVRAHTFENYPGVPIFDCGDKAGYRANPANKDNRSDMKILIHDYGLNFKFCRVDLLTSIDYVNTLFHPKKPCPCKEEILQIDRKCEILIEGLEGGYHFPKQRGKPPGDKPYKDKYYDDPCDAFRYGVENFVKWGIPYTYTEVIPNHKSKSKNPWDWMENLENLFQKDLIS